MSHPRRTVTVHSWDPYHGDLNNRFPRLGAPIKRLVPKEAWHSALLYQPAIYGNGLFADNRGPRPIDAALRMFGRNHIESNALSRRRHAFGQQAESFSRSI